jgi:AraC-like DNA-binding protein
MNVLDNEKQIHLTCFNYYKEEDGPLIEIKHLKSGVTGQLTPKINEIVILLKGVMNVSSRNVYNKQITAGAILFFPAKCNCKFEIKKEITFIVFKLNIIGFSFCDHFSIEKLYKEKIDQKAKIKDIHVLQINNAIKTYVNLLTIYLKDQLYCGFLLEIKLREFLYILRYYYPVQELKAFFSPMLCEDFMFLTLVGKTYHSKITVSEMASKVHYSVSGFEKRFKKVFGMSPLEWMKLQRAQAIYHELNCSTKTFSELVYEFGFSSPSHFNNFCKKTFKNTPGSIRKNT